jgi:predicted transcriptional regulator
MRPGSYLIEPMESGMLSLSPEEDAAVQAGLDEIDRGDTLLARDVFKQLDETLRKR